MEAEECPLIRKRYLLDVPAEILWSSELSFLFRCALCFQLLGFMFHDGMGGGEDFQFLAAVCHFYAGMDDMEEDIFLDYRHVVDMIQVTPAEPMAEKLARPGPL